MLFDSSGANYGFCTIYSNLSSARFSRAILFVYRMQNFKKGNERFKPNPQQFLYMRSVRSNPKCCLCLHFCRRSGLYFAYHNLLFIMFPFDFFIGFCLNLG